MLTVAAPDRKSRGLGGQRGGADDDTGYSNEMRHMSSCEVANGELRCGRVQEQLVLWELDILLGGVNNTLRTDFERRFELHWSATMLSMCNLNILVV
jgi:hypothetical protein